MKLTFWGAAQTVTGSMHELGVNGARILLDCGTYQGRRRQAYEVNAHFPFPAPGVQCVILSHAHIDHSGNLPTLVKNGFTGPIYTTPATVDLCHPMLLDSAYLQEKDAAFMAKRRSRRKALGDEFNGEPVEPVHTVQDAENTLPLFRPVELGSTLQVTDSLTCRTVDAGHMLGSTSMVLEESGGKVRLGFSGDVGRKNLPIIRDPEALPPVDYLIMESTYGDRLHKDIGHVEQRLKDVVRRTAARGGKIICPAFAVGRTQQVVLLLHKLMEQESIPSIPIFVDSPLAINVTDVFRKHSTLYDDDADSFLKRGKDPFGFSRLRYVREVAESKALNELHGPAVIISASGMCEAGRILHHLRNNIDNPRNTVLITGFQAEHTLGRKIIEKLPEVPIFGELVPLRAEVVKLNELSGHADQGELLAWMKPAVKGLKRVFLVHGEPAQQAALAKAIESAYGLPVTIPKRGDSFQL